jgi:hypothetical protein
MGTGCKLAALGVFQGVVGPAWGPINRRGVEGEGCRALCGAGGGDEDAPRCWCCCSVAEGGGEVALPSLSPCMLASPALGGVLPGMHSPPLSWLCVAPGVTPAAAGGEEKGALP